MAEERANNEAGNRGYTERRKTLSENIFWV